MLDYSYIVRRTGHKDWRRWSARRLVNGVESLVIYGETRKDAVYALAFALRNVAR